VNSAAEAHRFDAYYIAYKQNISKQFQYAIFASNFIPLNFQDVRQIVLKVIKNNLFILGLAGD
jgi:hypothetical protein